MVRKIFVIGFNKTATTTFHNIFVRNGLKSLHHPIWDNFDYDAYSDFGGRKIFKKLDRRFDDSIFILNTRNIDDWLLSRFKHGLKLKNKFKHSKNMAYPYSEKLIDRWLRNREKYHSDILKHFEINPTKLIIVDVSKPEWVKYLCDQLEFKVYRVSSGNVRITNNDYEEHQNILNMVNNYIINNKIDKDLLIKNKSLLKEYLNLYRNNIIK